MKEDTDLQNMGTSTDLRKALNAAIFDRLTA